MQFDDEIVQSYPYPIAMSVRLINDTKPHTSDYYLRLANLFEVSLTYLTSISLAQYLRDDVKDPHIQTQIKQLPRPTLGTWNSILNACVDFYATHKEHPFAVLELRDGYAAKLLDHQLPGTEALLAWYRFTTAYLDEGSKQNISLQSVVERTVKYRNKTWGHRIRQLPFPKFLEEHTEPFFRGMQGLLEWMAFLKDYPLRYIKEARRIEGKNKYVVFDYMGTSCRQGTYVGDQVQERRLYLCDRQGMPILSIHPLFVVHQRRLYVLEGHKQDEYVGYSDCETGEPFEPSRLTSYYISRLVDDRFNKLPDIEFPVPPEDDGLEVDESSLMPMFDELIAQLNDEGRQALEIALGESLRIGRFWLGIECLLMGLSRQNDRPLSDLIHQLRESRSWVRGALRKEVVGRVATDDNRQQKDVVKLGAKAWDRLQPADPTAPPSRFHQDRMLSSVVTPRMMQILRDAARLAGAGQIGHGHLLLAALAHSRSPAVRLLHDLAARANWSQEEVLAWVEQRVKPVTPIPARKGLPFQQGQYGYARPPALSGEKILATFGRNLTDLAHQGKLRPAIGPSAHKAMVQIARILQQTQTNNPILLGEPGVGKTAIVEGLAYRLATDPQVVSQLASKQFIELSPTALLADGRYRGDREERLQQLVKEMRAATGDMIVFIDEIHTIWGGVGRGLETLASILELALARGDFSCIGATTISGYERHVKSNPTLARCFTPVRIAEPPGEEVLEIAKLIAREYLGPSHRVEYSQTAVEEAVRLSKHYLPGERLPGKVIKLLDQAGARTAMTDTLRGQQMNEERPVTNVVTTTAIHQVISEFTGDPLAYLSDDHVRD